MGKIRGVNRKFGLAKEIMKLGHTFGTLAKELGCSSAIIGKWCNGDHRMGSKYVIKLKKMGVPVEAILDPVDYTEKK